MALDYYVGSLTRYATQDWENVMQVYAREQGMEYHALAPGSEEEPPQTAEEVGPAVLSWRDAMNAAMGEHFDGPLTWDEGTATPYFTDRPGWKGRHGLLLWAAYAERPQLDPPEALPDELQDDPAYAAVDQAGGSDAYQQILFPSIWLPCPFDFAFGGTDIYGEETVFGSSPTLVGQLEALNAATFGLDRPGLAEAAANQATADDPLEACARYGLAISLQLARKSVEHRLPMLLDF